MTHEWIRCSEKLPKKTGYYLVTCFYNAGEETDIDLRRLAVSFYDAVDKIWQYSGLMTVIAWKHGLPGIYKGEI